MNKSDFLNTLRDASIQEYLNADRNRSSFLAHQIKNSVSRFEGALDPEKYEQMNELELRNTNETVNEIKQKLLDTFNNLNTLYNDDEYGTTQYSKLYNAIGNYTTVLIDYNKLITLYLTTTNNIMTRQSIFSTLMGTKELYSQLKNVAFSILKNYDDIPDPRIRSRAINKYFVKVLLLASLYDIINKQFDGNQFQIIPESTILINVKFLPDWVKKVIEDFNLKLELYGITTPEPPPTGKPPWGSLGGPFGGPFGGPPPSSGGPPPPPPPPTGGLPPPSGGPSSGGPSSGTSSSRSLFSQSQSGYSSANSGAGGEGTTERYADVFGGPAGETSTTERRPAGVDLRPFLSPPSSSSRPTAQAMAPVLPQRLHPQSEEGSIQGQEQEPDTRRTVTPQGSPPQGTPPQGSPKSVTTELFELSPEKKGLINVGSIDEPVYVKHNHLTEDEIKEFINLHAVGSAGEKVVKANLTNVNHDIIEIASHIKIPIELLSKLQEYFPDSDDTKIACFVYASFLFGQLNKADEEDINELETLVADVTKSIFAKETTDWLEKVFELMTRSTAFSYTMEAIYKEIMGSDIDLGVIYIFEEQPPLEPIPDTGQEQKEEEPSAEGDDDEDDDDEDDEGNDDDDEGDDDGGDDEEDTFEAFKKEHQKLSEKLKGYREGVENVFNSVLKQAKESYEKGKELTLFFTDITDKIPQPAIKLTREVLKYLIESPLPWLGLLFFLVIGEYVPLHGDETIIDWAIEYMSRKSKQAVTKALPIRVIMRLLGLRTKYADPEVSAWARLIFMSQNAIFGVSAGTYGQLVIDLMNKLMYRIELTSRYKYPIPDGNVVLDMLAVTDKMSKLIALGPAALMLKNGKGYKKAPKAVLDEVYALMDKVEKLELKYEKKEGKPVKFPFPAHALELKKNLSEPTLPKVSEEAQYNPNLSSGDEAGDELGDFTKRPNKGAKTSVGLNVAPQSGASSSSASKSTIHATTKKGKGFIKGQVLKPIDERVVIGSSAPLPYNDLSNDSFLIKPRSYEPVV